MKMLNIKKMTGFLALAMTLGLGASSIQAAQQDDKQFKDGVIGGSLNCDAESCVAFEVTIRMDDTTLRPVQQQSTSYIVVNGMRNPYGEFVNRSNNFCSKQVRIPKDVYSAITTIFKSITTAGENGEQPPALTPTQQTFLLFYTTLMQQTLQFDCKLASDAGRTSGGN